MVVELEPGRDSGPGLGYGVIGLQIYLFVFEAAPEALDNDVVHAAALAVHAHPNISLEQHPREALAGELASLVAVEDFRLALGQSLPQSRQAELHLQADGKAPGQDEAAVPVHDGHQVQEATAHGNVGYVDRPHLVGPGNRNTA